MSIPISAWIKESDTARSVPFTAPPGLATWSVYYATNDGTGTVTAMTTPNVVEIDATNMPGCWYLDINDASMVTRGNSNNFETVVLFISALGWSGTSVSYVLYTESP
jgi:hypothetical protein